METKVNEKELQVVRFQDVAVTYLEKDGQRWLTGEDIGRCLDYAEPRKAVHKLFKRHEEELGVFKSVVTLTTDHGEREVIVFNEQGAYILAMFAKTEKAKDLRAWLASLPKLIRENSTAPGYDDAGFYGTLNTITAGLTAILNNQTIANKNQVQIHNRLSDTLARMDTLLDLQETAMESQELLAKHQEEMHTLLEDQIDSGGMPRQTRGRLVDSIKLFVDSEIKFSPGLLSLPPVLFDAYKDFCEDNELAPVGKHMFYMGLRNVCHPRLTRHRRGTKEYFGGIGLRNTTVSEGGAL